MQDLPIEGISIEKRFCIQFYLFKHNTSFFFCIEYSNILFLLKVKLLK